MLKKSICSLAICSVMLSLTVAPAPANIITNLKTRDIEVSGEGTQAKMALQNAREKALNVALGSLIQTEAEREKLNAYLPALYKDASSYLKRLKIVGKGTTKSGGRFYKISYRVDIQALKTRLIQQGIVPKQSVINEALDFPTLAVYFKDPLNTSDAAQWSIQRCNSLLLDEGFQVIDPKVWEKLAKEDLKLSQTRQVNSQRTALKANANVFLEISLDPKVAGKSGDYTYIHAPVRVRAFESSSGQAFLDKSYAPLDKAGQPEAFAIQGSLDTSTKVVVEEALAGVMPMIVYDLNRHWKSSLRQGRQYRLFFSSPLSEVQTRLLQSKVKAYDLRNNGEVYIRYDGELSELADELEEALEPDYVLQSVDLGQAHFHKAPQGR